MSEEKRRAAANHPIKDAIANAINTTGNIYTGAVDTVSAAVRNTLAAARSAGASTVGAMTQVALGAIRGTLEIGTDLTQATKGILVGMLHGSRECGEASLRTISHTARTVIQHTAMTGSDVTGATTGLVEGAIQSAMDSGGDVHQAASAAAQGASDGADEVSFAAAEQVRAAVTDRFPGVRILLLPPYQRQDRT